MASSLCETGFAARDATCYRTGGYQRKPAKCEFPKPQSLPKLRLADILSLPTWPPKPGRLIAAGWSSPVAREAHNLEVVGSNPAPATCFDGSETRVPSGYTKGRHLRVTAFSRSIASCGNDFEHCRPSQSLRLAPPRDILSRQAIRFPTPLSPETLGCL